MYVVFAGVHVTEEDAGQIAADSLTCPTDKNGFVDLTGKPSTVDCNLKGANLQTIAKVRLRNAHESTDGAQLDADLAAAGAVTFNTADLAKLTGVEYSVILVDKSGHEIPTKITLKFAQLIKTVDDLSFGTASCATNCTVNVTGARLTSIQTIVLSNDTDSVDVRLDSQDGSNGSATFQKSAFKKDGDYSVSYKTTSNDTAVPAGLKIKVSGTQQ